MENIFRTRDQSEVLRYNYSGIDLYSGFPQYTYDSKGNLLTVENSDGYSFKRTCDSNGNELTCEDSDGDWYKKTYDSNGNQLTFEASNGYCSKSTYDSNGNKLTFEDSDGVKRSFDIKEYELFKTLTKL